MYTYSHGQFNYYYYHHHWARGGVLAIYSNTVALQIQLSIYGAIQIINLNASIESVELSLLLASRPFANTKPQRKHLRKYHYFLMSI